MWRTLPPPLTDGRIGRTKTDPMTFRHRIGLSQRTAVYDQTTITFGIRGPLARSDLPGLCDRVCGLLETSRATVALCDVSGIRADAVAVDALARLQLAAYRHGCRVRLRQCTPELRDLVAFMGLADVLVE
jgi:ABC-type transporter Mla MlaB component